MILLVARRWKSEQKRMNGGLMQIETKGIEQLGQNEWQKCVCVI